MHIRLFCVFLSALAITFSYFGMNDHFAVFNSEVVQSRPQGWPTGKSVQSAFKNPDTDVKCLFNFPYTTECENVHLDTDKHKLKADAATIEPSTRAEFKQGIDGRARRTNKNDIEYGDVQIPTGWKIPDLPDYDTLKGYVKNDKDDERLKDWDQVCLRDETDTQVGDNIYPMLYRDGKRIPDPHALDKKVWVMPIRIYETATNTYKKQKKEIIDTAIGANGKGDGACTYAFIFPTAQSSTLHMLACGQANTDRTRRDMRKSFGFKQDAKHKKMPSSFRAFWDVAKEFVDGYSTTNLPAMDSYLGQWLENYASIHNPISPDNAAPFEGIQNDRSANADGTARPFGVVDCTADKSAITAYQCGLEETATAGTVNEGVLSVVGAPWAKLVCEKGDADTKLKITASLTKLEHPVLWKYVTGVAAISYKGTHTAATVNAIIECKGPGSSSFNLVGGETGCKIEVETPNTIYRVLPGYNLFDYVETFTGPKDWTAMNDVIIPHSYAHSGASGVICTKTGAAPPDHILKTTGRNRPYAFTKGTQTTKLTPAQWDTLADFMELHVKHHSKQVPFDGGSPGDLRSADGTAERAATIKYQDAAGNDDEDYSDDVRGYMWQPFGPDSKKVEHLCVSTMNSYHTLKKTDAVANTKHNGRADFHHLGGMGHGHCFEDATEVFQDSHSNAGACYGQYDMDGAHANIHVNAIHKNQLYGAFARSRYLSADLPELQPFRTAMYSWWYRGPDSMEEKLDAISSMSHHTDQITDDNQHCDSFVSPASDNTNRYSRFAYTLSQSQDMKHFLSMGADDRVGAEDSTGGAHFNMIGGIPIERYANTHFDQIGDSMNTDLKCQRTCKNIKATNGVILVAGALYLISVIGLVLPYNDSDGKPNMQTKAFLFVFFVITTCFTVSLLIHSGSLQRIQTGHLECTFHNDTAFFDVTTDNLKMLENTDTQVGYGLLLLWIGAGFSALCWFVTAALTIAVMQAKDQTYLGGVSVNEFFFNG